MDFYIVTEAEERLRRIENEEDIQKICEEIIYDPYENKEILIYMISILIEKLKHYTEPPQRSSTPGEKIIINFCN